MLTRDIRAHCPRLTRTSAALCLAVTLTACRWVRVSSDPSLPKQGDIIKFTITAGESENIAEVYFKVGDQEGTVKAVPHTVSVNTCKLLGKYLTSIPVHVKATYNDADTRTLSGTYDLTSAATSRDDQDATYAIYVAHDDDSDREDLRIGMANAFMDNFSSYSRSQYYWAEPGFYTSSSLSYGDSVDMAISFGHGSHHYYQAGKSSSDGVYLDTTAFGSCAPCYNTGDLRYLVFASCQTLSMETYSGNSFWYYWFHDASTKLDKRPFAGLHMTLGFRTNHRIVHWWLDNDSEDFFEAFADNLDGGVGVVNAWQEAAGDELSFDDGKNRTAVIYLKQYEQDRISTRKDSYIYANPNYADQWIDYWE